MRPGPGKLGPQKKAIHGLLQITWETPTLGHSESFQVSSWKQKPGKSSVEVCQITAPLPQCWAVPGNSFCILTSVEERFTLIICPKGKMASHSRAFTQRWQTNSFRKSKMSGFEQHCTYSRSQAVSTGPGCSSWHRLLHNWQWQSTGSPCHWSRSKHQNGSSSQREWHWLHGDKAQRQETSELSRNPQHTWLKREKRHAHTESISGFQGKLEEPQ